MAEPVREVAADLLIRANRAAADGPRGFENATISIIKALIVISRLSDGRSDRFE